MRRLLIAALVLAGLVAPPAVLAQVGGSPGITSPVSFASPTLTGTTTFGLGTCISTVGSTPLTTATPSLTFTGQTTSGLCWDGITAAGGFYAGPAIFKDGRELVRWGKSGGTFFGFNAGGTVYGKVLDFSGSGGIMYGIDSAAANASVAVAGWTYVTGASPIDGALTLGAKTALALQGTTTDANVTYIVAGEPTGTRIFTLPNVTGTALISTTANEFDTGNAVWANTGSFLFEGSTANNFETELDTIDPGQDNVIYLPDLSGTVLLAEPSASANGVNVTSGTYTGVFIHAANQFGVNLLNSVGTTSGTFSASPTSAQMSGNNATIGTSVDAYPHGLVVTNSGSKPTCDASTRGGIWRVEGGGGTDDTLEACGKDTSDVYSWSALATFPANPSKKSLYTLIQGGYTLSGTLTSAASTIKVTVVDTTPGIIDGDVQVCGYTTAGNQTALTKTCEILDFSGGAAALTTTATFVTVTNIKASSFSVLGGAGDETVAAEWTTGAVAIFAATNLVNSAVSDFVGVTVAETLWSPVCIDLAGCNIEPADLTSASDGKTLTVIGRDSTIGLVFTDSANMDIGAAGALTLGVGDAITLMYNSVNAKAWVEVSRSNN